MTEVTSNSTSQNIKPATGVFYDKADHAGFFRRLVATVIDTLLLLSVAFTLAFFWIIISPDDEHLPATFFITWLAVAYLYLALLKPTKVRTLGFIIAGIKIVDLAGNRPSFGKMTISFLLLGFILFGPLYILLDLLWLINDQYGQTLLNKIVGVYVVKQQAKPVATGVQKTVICHLLGFNFVFREVKLKPA